jgi:hypothetical protein
MGFLGFQLTPLPGVPAPSPDTRDGCTAYTAASAAAVKGKIAVIIRGNCPFVKYNSTWTMVL